MGRVAELGSLGGSTPLDFQNHNQPQKIMKQLFRIRSAGCLGAVFSLLLAGSSYGQPVTVDFESFNGMSFFGGTPVPASAQLSSQLLSSHGLLFSSDSGSPFVAVVALGANHATSGINGIGGVDSSGLLSYGTAFRIEFFLPSNPAVPAVTDFFSIRGDLIANGNHPVTLEAFDVTGGLLGSMTQIDSQPWTLSFAGAGIHSVHISQAPVAFSAAFDDLTFNALVAVPEPSAFALLGIGAIAMAGRFWFRRGGRQS